MLVVVLTNVMLFTKLMIKSQWITLDIYACTAIVLGAVFFLLVNHMILLNNRWFKGINDRLANINKRNLNFCSFVLLLNVFIACGLFFGY